MISIIMPSYNPNISNIIKTLEAIFDNIGNYEVILVLQKTASKNIKILDHHFQNEIKLKIINDAGIGISRARNKGVKLSVGNWILLLDDDVYIKSNIIKILENNLATNELFYYGNALVKGTNEHYVRFYITGKDIDIWSYNRVCSISLIINKEVFSRIGYFDEQLGSGTEYGSSEESDLILRALFNNIKIKYLDDYMIYHERAKHSLLKVEKYALGGGALYRKHIANFNIRLYNKLLIDLIIRFLFLFTFQKKRYVFLRGFFRGFFNYKKGKK